MPTNEQNSNVKEIKNEQTTNETDDNMVLSKKELKIYIYIYIIIIQLYIYIRIYILNNKKL